MPRSRVPRLISLGLLLLAGSVEPAWEVGHALAHLDLAADHHQPRESAPDQRDETLPAVSALPDAADHGHPVFQSPARPSTDLTPAFAVLHSPVFRLSLDESRVARVAFPGVSARGSPPVEGTVQPRAPPLA